MIPYIISILIKFEVKLFAASDPFSFNTLLYIGINAERIPGATIHRSIFGIVDAVVYTDFNSPAPIKAAITDSLTKPNILDITVKIISISVVCPIFFSLFIVLFNLALYFFD